MKKYIITFLTCLTILGCTSPHYQQISVPLASQEDMNEAKNFNTPPKGYGALYVYRNKYTPNKNKRKIYLDDKFIGKTEMGVFFYIPVKAGKHKLSVEAEGKNNDLHIEVASQKIYFIKQELTMDWPTPNTRLINIGEKRGKKDISTLKMAKTR